METFSFDARPRPKGRIPVGILVLPSGEIKPFEGKDMPGAMLLTASRYDQNGSWSGFIYTGALAPGVLWVELCRPTHHKGVSGACSWADLEDYLCKAVGGPKPEPGLFRACMRAAYPNAGPEFDRLDAKEQALQALQGPSPAPGPAQASQQKQGQKVKVYLASGQVLVFPIPAGDRVAKVSVIS